MQLEAEHDYSEKLGLSEIVVGVITRPTATMREISRGRFLPLAIAMFFLSALIANASSVLTETEMTQLLGGSIPALLVMMLIALFYLFGNTVLCYALARLFRCRGSFVTLLSLLAVANVPSVFTAPLALVRVMPGLVGEIFYGLGMIILGVWIAVLGVFAVRETFQLSAGRAVMIYLLPFILVLALLMLVIFLLLVASRFGT